MGTASSTSRGGQRGGEMNNVGSIHHLNLTQSQLVALQQLREKGGVLSVADAKQAKELATLVAKHGGLSGVENSHDLDRLLLAATHISSSPTATAALAKQPSSNRPSILKSKKDSNSNTDGSGAPIAFGDATSRMLNVSVGGDNGGNKINKGKGIMMGLSTRPTNGENISTATSNMHKRPNMIVSQPTAISRQVAAAQRGGIKQQQHSHMHPSQSASTAALNKVALLQSFAHFQQQQQQQHIPSIIPALHTADEADTSPLSDNIHHHEASPIKETSTLSESTENEISAAMEKTSLDKTDKKLASLPPPSMAELTTASSEQDQDPEQEQPATRGRCPSARMLPPSQTLPGESQDILQHLHAAERGPEENQYMSSETAPASTIAPTISPDYMRHQPDLSFRMREILLDWLLGVAARFNMRLETCCLMSSILDRFLCARSCRREQFQVLGLTSLILAAKYEEVLPPPLDDYLALTDRAFTRQAILHMEVAILQTLGYVLTKPTAATFGSNMLLHCPIDEGGSDNTTPSAVTGHTQRALIPPTRFGPSQPTPVMPVPSSHCERMLHVWYEYLLLASVQHSDMLHYSPSMQAAAIVCLALHQVRCAQMQVQRADEQGHSQNADHEAGLRVAALWDSELIEVSGGYTLIQLQPCMNSLIHYLQSMRQDCTAAASASSSVAPRYNSVFKRFSKEPNHAVALKDIILPKAY